jgi:hypothetical protein
MEHTTMIRKMSIASFAILAVFSTYLAHGREPPAVMRMVASAEAPTYEIGACKFRIANMFDGAFTLSTSQSPPRQGTYHLPLTGTNRFVGGAFGLFCKGATVDQIGLALGAKLINAKWLAFDPLADNNQLIPFEKGAHAHAIPLVGSNWQGIAITIDDTTGDDDGRARTFRFCLVHVEMALCGNTVVMWLRKPQHNDLDRIKAILQSVEFIDTPSSAPTSASTAAEHHQ